MSIFTTKAPWIMRRLMSGFALKDFHAAGIVGNLGHETGGFEKLQEIKPTVAGSKGGYGWAQWTGPRRRAYEAWCAAHKLNPASDDANFGYLSVELNGEYASAIAAVKRTTSLRAASDAFERTFEKAGVPALESRAKWAQRALDAYRASQDAAPEPVPAPLPPIPDYVPTTSAPSPTTGKKLGLWGSISAAFASVGAWFHDHMVIVLIVAAIITAIIVFVIVEHRKQNK